MDDTTHVRDHADNSGHSARAVPQSTNQCLKGIKHGYTKALQLAAILVFITIPLLAFGKNPHTAQPAPGPVMESCDCTPGFLLNEATDPDQYEGACTVVWK